MLHDLRGLIDQRIALFLIGFQPDLTDHVIEGGI